MPRRRDGRFRVAFRERVPARQQARRQLVAPGERMGRGGLRPGAVEKRTRGGGLARS